MTFWHHTFIVRELRFIGKFKIFQVYCFEARKFQGTQWSSTVNSEQYIKFKRSDDPFNSMTDQFVPILDLDYHFLLKNLPTMFYLHINLLYKRVLSIQKFAMLVINTGSQRYEETQVTKRFNWLEGKNHTIYFSSSCKLFWVNLFLDWIALVYVNVLLVLAYKIRYHLSNG